MYKLKNKNVNIYKSMKCKKSANFRCNEIHYN